MAARTISESVGWARARAGRFAEGSSASGPKIPSSFGPRHGCLPAARCPRVRSERVAAARHLAARSRPSRRWPPSDAGRKSPPPPPRITSRPARSASCAASGAVAAIGGVGVEGGGGGVGQAAVRDEAGCAASVGGRVRGGVAGLPGGIDARARGG